VGSAPHFQLAAVSVDKYERRSESNSVPPRCKVPPARALRSNNASHFSAFSRSLSACTGERPASSTGISRNSAAARRFVGRAELESDRRPGSNLGEARGLGGGWFVSSSSDSFSERELFVGLEEAEEDDKEGLAGGRFELLVGLGGGDCEFKVDGESILMDGRDVN